MPNTACTCGATSSANVGQRPVWLGVWRTAADAVNQGVRQGYLNADNLLRASAGLAQAVFHAPDERRARLRSLRRAVSQIEQMLQAEELGL